MAITATKEKQSGSKRQTSAPYYVNQDDEATYLDIATAIDTAETQATSDYGFAPGDYTFNRLSEYTIRVTCLYDTEEIRQRQGGGYTPQVSLTEALKIAPPKSRYLERPYQLIQKTPGSAPGSDNRMSFLEAKLATNTTKIVWTPPQENYSINFEFPAGHLTPTHVAAFRDAAHTINASLWNGIDAQHAILLRADLSIRKSGKATINAGFNVGQSYTESWENQKDSTTHQLTNVKPFSHISYIGEFHIETHNDVDTEFIHKTALYELRVLPVSDWSTLPLPS